MKNMQISAPTTVNLDELQTIIERNTLFQKKAMETKLLHDSFKFLELILDFVQQLGGIKSVFKSYWIKSNSKAWLNLNSQFSSWILMMVYHRQESEDKPWTYIFHEFLHKEGYKRRNILTRQSVLSYYKLTKAFLSHLPQELRLEAEEICRFFERNQLDPYSSVVGLYASEEVINAAMEVDEIALIQMVERELDDLKSKKSTYKEKYTEVLRKLTIWSKYNDPANTVLEMQYFLSVLRGMNQVAQGSIVLVKKEMTNAIVTGKQIGRAHV